MLFNVLIKNYLVNATQNQKSTYDGMIVNFNSILRCFEKTSIRSVKDLKYESLIEILNYYRNNTKCKNSSINKMIAYIKAVLRFGGYKTHEFLLVKKLRNDTIHTQIINDDALEKILVFIKNMNSSKNSLVHKTIIYTLYDTGCRISELLNIKINNIDLINRNILLEESKTGPRYVFYSNLSEAYIKELITVNPQKVWLFWNIEKNRQFNRDSDMKYLLKKIKEKLGLSRLSNHQFRKTMATNLIKRGAKLKTVQFILGHVSQKTTEIYVDYKMLDAKKEYDAIKAENSNYYE